MKINLSELEQKAKAVNVPEHWSYREFTDLGRIDVSFIDAMSPTTALALIRVARAAIEYVNEPDREGYYAEHWYSLKESLKEIAE